MAACLKRRSFLMIGVRCESQSSNCRVALTTFIGRKIARQARDVNEGHAHSPSCRVPARNGDISRPSNWSRKGKSPGSEPGLRKSRLQTQYTLPADFTTVDCTAVSVWT